MSATAGIFGIGKGDAQVIGTNPGLVNLQRAFAEDQRRKQLEDAQIQGELSKINLDGSRNADTGKLFDMYNQIKNTNAQLRNTRNNLDRNKLLQDIAGQKQQLLTAANLSKQANQNEQKFAQLRLDRHNELKDDYGNNYTNLIGTSIFDPSYQQKAQYFNDPFQPTYDTDKLAKEIQDRTIATTKGKPYTKSIGGWNQLLQDETTKVDETAAKNLLMQNIASDPALRKTIMAQYQKGDTTPEQATSQFVDNFIQSLRAKNKVEQKQIGDQAPQRWSPSEAWNLKHYGTPNAPRQGDTEKPTYYQNLAEGIRQGDEGAKQAFGKAIENNPAYLNGIQYQSQPNGNLKITIPAKYKYDENVQAKYNEQVRTGTVNPATEKKYAANPNAGRIKVQDAHTYELNPNDPNEFHSAFASIYQNATGDATAKAPKALTIGGKGYVPGGIQSPTITNRNTSKVNPVNKHKKAAKDYGL